MNKLSGEPPGREPLGGPEEQHRLLMECVTDYAVFFLDTHGRVAAWNAGAERFFGYPEAEIVGQHVSCFFAPEDVQKGQPEMELQAAAAGRANDEHWLVRKDGTRLWCNGVTTALWDDGGTLRGFAKVLQDCTEQKRLVEALRQRAEELAEDARRKDEFLAVLAHDLRNHLAPVCNALQVIWQEGGDRPTVQQAAAMIDRQRRCIVRQVEVLLNVSRLTQGRIQLCSKRE
jgi:PAS domain S-box-containing protein